MDWHFDTRFNVTLLNNANSLFHNAARISTWVALLFIKVFFAHLCCEHSDYEHIVKHVK